MRAFVRNSMTGLAGALAAAAFCLGTPTLAGAAGLGELRVASSLGQPLKAEVDIVSSQRAEADFAARVARLADSELDPVVYTLQIKLVRRGGRSVLQLSTHQPVNTPYIELPLELSSNVARITRHYTLLLDPPAIARGPQPGLLVTAAPLR
jgi:pilus assembly protein FimV